MTSAQQGLLRSLVETYIMRARDGHNQVWLRQVESQLQRTYFGWIGVDITNDAVLTGQVTGFAYENNGGSIPAGAVPEPAGLALLALGAPALLRRRTRA